MFDLTGLGNEPHTSRTDIDELIFLLYAIFNLLIFPGYLSCQVSADCGNQNLRESIDLLKYDRFGRTTRESCRWTFNIPRNESTILMLDIKKFSAFRQGTPQNAHLILPDGESSVTFDTVNI